MAVETNTDLGYRVQTAKAFDAVVADIERLIPEHKFRVLAIHDVQATLQEKGFERAPLKIIEVCSAAFANEALSKSIDVAMFMPCKYTVYTEGERTHVTLVRPSMISQMMPGVGLEALATQVETTLKTIMDAAVK
jgi:uncharacterized protein (DUF302 family)